MGIGALYFGIPPLRMALIEADPALSRSAREEVIGWVARGSLPESEEHGGYVMPEETRGLSAWGLSMPSTTPADSACSS